MVPPMASSQAPATLPLGPFTLDVQLGTGGMANVWRGFHRLQRVPVAVKVIHAGMAADETFVSSLRSEVLSVARLHHPRIITLLEYGSVDAGAERASHGQLVAGSPYLAMELASGGTLADVAVPMPWPTLRATLFAMLDALAHAHARGVIHRDLKPHNVLLCTRKDARPGLKLTDFGLACPSDRALDIEREAHVAGTPHFMAPEQLRGEWRDYGPWTDLYALGVMAYYLACGCLPFDGPVEQVMQMHIRDAVPEPVLGNGVPPGLTRWMMRLLQKDPRARFDCAADAAFALMALTETSARSTRTVGEELAEALDTLQVGEDGAEPAPVEPAEGTRLVRPDARERAEETADTLVDQAPPAMELRAGRSAGMEALPVDLHAQSVHAQLTALAWDSRDHEEPTLELTDGPSVDLEALSAPPLPATWRREGEHTKDQRLLGAGLGLYGMRSVPLVDRQDARDAVWSALQRVHRDGRLSVLTLQGQSGTGKTRLAEWMCQRVAEVGGAAVLRASHAAQPGGGQGLAWMLAVTLGCSGLPAAALSARVARQLTALGMDDPQEHKAMVDLVSSALPGHSDEHRNTLGTRERHVLIRRYLQALATRRPVVLWLDDVQWGPDALGLVAHLVETARSHPVRVLVLMTAQDEALAQQPGAAAQLKALGASALHNSISLAPLTPADHRALVGELLGLDGQLADTVAERTAGNPLFAVQLVGDWVQRGVLRLGRQGFVLRSDEAAAIPDNIHAVWRSRVRQLPQDMGRAAHRALEVGSVLGTHLDVDEWKEACAHAGVPLPPEVIHALVAARLLVRVGGSLHFVHGLLRESMERAAREAGLLEAHHRACATALKPRAALGRPGAHERMGRHLLAAGDARAALDPLLRGAAERLRTSDYPGTHALLDLVEETCESARLPATDSRWGACWVLRAQVLLEEGRTDEARQHAERAEGTARQQGWLTVGGDAQAALGALAYLRGDAAQSRDAYRQARTLHQRAGHGAGVLEALQGEADAAYRLGDWEKAGSLYLQALTEAQSQGNTKAMALAHWGLGYVAMWQNRHAEARASFEHQLSLWSTLGSRLGQSQAHNALGEVARARGDLAEANVQFRRCLALVDAIGAGSRNVPLLNIILVLCLAGRFREARAELDRVWPEVENGAHMTLALGGLGLMAICDAHDGRWERHDTCIDRLEGLFASRAVRDPDIPLSIQLAAQEAAQAGQVARARRAWTLAHAQWKSLGREDNATEVNRLLKALPRA